MVPTRVRIGAAGGPEVLVVEPLTVPVPADDELVIAVRAAGINRHDCVQRSRGPGHASSDVPGLEVAGTVLAVGAGVTGWREGERVCALTDGGGYATHARAKAAQALPVPAGISDTEAAALPEAAFTVAYNFFDLGRLAPGEAVLLHGGTSGVGTFAIQALTALGHPVFASCGTADKCAMAMRLGARLAVDYHDPSMADQVLAATDGRGVDVVLDMSGGRHTGATLAMLARRGRFLHLSPGGGRSIEIPLQMLMAREASVTGSFLRPLPDARKAVIAQTVRERFWPAIPARIRPVVHATFPLHEAVHAHRLLESGAVVGKLVLCT